MGEISAKMLQPIKTPKRSQLQPNVREHSREPHALNNVGLTHCSATQRISPHIFISHTGASCIMTAAHCFLLFTVYSMSNTQHMNREKFKK